MFTREAEKALEKLAWSIATAALLGLAGWVYSVGNRVAAIEARQTGIEHTLNDIHEDVRSINTHLMGGDK